MSKLQVNISSKLNAEPISIESVIKRGRKINRERCQKESKVQQFAKIKSSGAKREQDVYVCKLVYPREAINPKCDHINQLPILNRSTFTPEEYINFLSKPKTRNSFGPRQILQVLAPCTAHLNFLSQPLKRRLYNTFHSYRQHFTFSLLESLLNHIHFGDNQTLEHTLRAIRQQIEDRKRKINTQQCEITKLKEKIGKDKTFNKLSLCFETLILDDLINQTGKSVKDDIECRILVRLCQKMNYKVPDISSNDSIDKVYIQFAQRIALQIKSVNNAAPETHCKKKFIRMCYPIMNFHQDFPERSGSQRSLSDSNHQTSKISSNVSTVKTSDDETAVFDREKLEKLRQDCEQMNERLLKESVNLEAIRTKRKNKAESKKLASDKRREIKRQNNKNRSGSADGSTNDASNSPRIRKQRDEGKESYALADQKWEVEWVDQESKRI